MGRRIALGTKSELTEPEFARSVLVEFLLTFIFVFVGVATVMTAERMDGGKTTVMGLATAAGTNAMLVAVMVAVGMDVSAGHLNPAVTIGFTAAGYVTVFRCVMYVVAQMVASGSACLLLGYITGEGLEGAVHTLGSGLRPVQGLLMEAVLTFAMVFCIYAIVADPKKGVVSSLAPLLIGLIVGANTLAGGPFSGASMNPARSFGPAVVSWSWDNHWIYWAGPLVGSSLGGFVYEHLFHNRPHDALPVNDDYEEAILIN